MNVHEGLLREAKRGISLVFLDGGATPDRIETSLLELLDTVHQCLRKLGRPAKPLKS